MYSAQLFSAAASGEYDLETRNAMGFRCLDNLDAVLAGRHAPDAVN